MAEGAPGVPRHSLDRLAFMRPTRQLADPTVPGAHGLFTCGASTAPVGGSAGSSGKAAALKLLKGCAVTGRSLMPEQVVADVQAGRRRLLDPRT